MSEEEDLVGKPELLLKRDGLRVYDGFRGRRRDDEEITESSSVASDDDIDTFLEGSDDMVEEDSDDGAIAKGDKGVSSASRQEGFHAWSKEQRRDATAPGAEHEFGVLPDDPGSDTNGLNMRDLIGSAATALNAKSLVKGHEELLAFDKKLVIPSGLAGAREAKRVQRQVAKELAHKEVSKWSSTVKVMDRANLQFPLRQEGEEEDADSADIRNVAARFSADAIGASGDTAKTEEGGGLEAKINELLRQSGVANGDSGAIDLVPNNMSAEEVRARRAELRRMRYQMMYKHQKAARQKKIKSKKYRKLVRKQREKEALSDRQLMEADELTAKEMANKAERERIRERVTQRHRNTGKWVQHKMKRGPDGISADEKAALSSQMRRHHDLLQKQYDMTGDELVTDLDGEEGGEVEEAVPARGLFAMEFMQRPAKRAQAKLARTKEKLEEERRMMEEAMEDARLGGGASAERVHFEDIEPSRVELLPSSRMELKKGAFSGSHAARASGPMTVDVGNAGLGFEVAPFPEEDAPSAANLNKKVVPSVDDSSGKKNGKEKKKRAKAEKKAKKSKRGRKSDEIEGDGGDVLSVDAASSVTMTLPIAKPVKSGGDDGSLHVAPAPGVTNPWLVSATTEPEDSRAAKKKRKGETKSSSTTQLKQVQLSSEDSEEPEEVPLVKIAPPKKAKTKRKQKAFDLQDTTDVEQRTLIQVAFDKDDVLEELERERDQMKKKKAGSQKDGAAGLPGWGAWTGPGVAEEPEEAPKAPEPKQRKRKRGKVAPEDRLVVRNTKPTNKQWAKFTSSGLVQDREISQDVHNRTLRHPLGPEWNPPSAYKRMIHPKVSVKPGANVEPLSEQMKPADYREFIRDHT